MQIKYSIILGHVHTFMRSHSSFVVFKNAAVAFENAKLWKTMQFFQTLCSIDTLKFDDFVSTRKLCYILRWKWLFLGEIFRILRNIAHYLNWMPSPYLIILVRLGFKIYWDQISILSESIYILNHTAVLGYCVRGLFLSSFYYMKIARIKYVFFISAVEFAFLLSCIMNLCVMFHVVLEYNLNKFFVTNVMLCLSIKIQFMVWFVSGAASFSLILR